MLRTFALLVEYVVTGLEAVQPVFGGVFAVIVGGHQMGKAPTRGRHRLEAAVVPAAVQIKSVNMRLVDNRAAVRGHIHNPAPAAQDLGLADHRHQGHPRLHHMFDHRQVAALGVGGIEIQIAAKDQAAFVRLGHIKMPHAKADHVIDAGLQPLGYKGLQNMAFNRHTEPRHRRDLTGAACNGHPDLLGFDWPLGGLDPHDFAVFNINTGDFAVLDNIDTLHISPTRIAPGHRIVPRSAAPRVIKPAIDRKARIVEVQVR